ncbi:tigger transposable element-derived protein 1 [Trichonephila clavipes]|nr:tigger transposable element-derived protein 1 [Trichonephila clavipes]
MPVGKRFGQHVGQTIHTTTETSTLSDEIINLAHEIGGDGFNTFSHDDIDELLVDDALSDNDIIDLTLDLTVDGVVGLEGDNDEEEKSTPLTGKLIQGLQLCSKLENHFLINDPNSERASKLQRELQNCMSGYRELYKKIKESSSQKLITDYIVRKGRATQNENEVCEDPWLLPQISIAQRQYLLMMKSDTNDFNSLHTIDTVKVHASLLPLACSLVCVCFTLPSPQPIDSVKGHATLPSLLADLCHPTA